MGWYSTGPKIRTNDVDIHELFTDYHPNPAFVIVDVSPDNVGCLLYTSPSPRDQ